MSARTWFWIGFGTFVLVALVAAGYNHWRATGRSTERPKIFG